MTRSNDSLRILLSRTKLALGSMSLVEKQLLEICTVLTDELEKFKVSTQGDEEEKSDRDFFITPLVEIYESHS